MHRQASYDVSLNDTFKAGGGSSLNATIRLRPEGMEGASGQGFSDIELADLDKGKMVGKGASGRVFLVMHKKDKQRYALKELTAIADKSARDQALNELRIASKHCQQSEHIVRLVDGYFHDGKIAMLMEYCDGGSLEDQLKLAKERAGGGGSDGVSASGLPLGPLALQILHGVRYMHEQMKQVHRDLKPANILLTSEGVVKLSDFGVSKQLNGTHAMAMTQVGTTSYMAPERLQGDEYSYASDVWSVGVIVLEALRGAHPFQASSFMAICKAICESAYPPPPEGTPADQGAFVHDCLQIDAAARKTTSALIESEWLRPLSGRDTRQAVFKWLMAAAAAAANATKAKAREMALRAIASSDEGLSGDPRPDWQE